MRRITDAFVLALIVAACGDQLVPTAPSTAANPTGRTADQSLAPGAPIIVHFPGEGPGPVYYALLGRGVIPNDAGWAGIVFVRSPSCVPSTFNLLDRFNPPTAWGCELTVEGEQWWHDLSTPPPFQTHTRGTGAVPVYFVRWSQLQAAIADDLLTIGELQSLPSLLIGRASFLEHIVHNTHQAANHGHETLVAHGRLDDGRTFEFRYNEKFLPETGEHVFPNVKVAFR